MSYREYQCARPCSAAAERRIRAGRKQVQKAQESYYACSFDPLELVAKWRKRGEQQVRARQPQMVVSLHPECLFWVVNSHRVWYRPIAVIRRPITESAHRHA